MSAKQNFHRPLIGVTMGTDDKLEFSRIRTAYIEAVWGNGGQPILIPNCHDSGDSMRWVQLLDGILFTGGEDIHPLFFRSEPHSKLETVDIERDYFELELCRAWLKSSKPLFAICRGLQLLNVACGGTLYQDISERKKTNLQHRQPYRRDIQGHNVKILPGTLLSRILKNEKTNARTEKSCPVNSIHHQAINKLGKGLSISALSSDGIIEAVEHKTRPFVLGVQWHPEELLETLPLQKKLFSAFIEQARS